MQLLFEALLQNIREAAVIWMFSGQIVGWNHSAERVYGYSNAEALQLRFETLIPEKKRGDLTPLMEKIIRGEVPRRSETIRQTKDGNYIRVFVNVIPIMDDRGRVSHFLELADPFPGREQAILSLAHNLRNSLSSISALSYLLEHNFERRHLGRLNRQLLLCESIVNNLLQYGGVRQVRPETVELNHLAREVVSMLDVPESIHVEFVSPAEVTASVDPGQIEQVLINLVQNSVDALEGTPGRIAIHITDESPDVWIEVSDNGPGISFPDVQQVFEPLVTTKVNGIGLGLAACKQMVEANQGRILVESERGRGAKFTVILPKA